MGVLDNRKGDGRASNRYRQRSIEIQKKLSILKISQELGSEINRFVLRSSFRIEWCKNFQENVTDLKNTVDNEGYSFFSTFCFDIEI